MYKPAFLFIICLLWSGLAGAAEREPTGKPSSARIITEDIDRFWQAWDIAMKTDDPDTRAKAFFENYYLPGSRGLRDFISQRIHSVFQLVETIDQVWLAVSLLNMWVGVSCQRFMNNPG